MPSCNAAHRAALLRVIDAQPGIISTALPQPWGSALSALHRHYDDPAPPLCRTRETTESSRFRYHNAEHFFRGIGEQYFLESRRDLLYRAGIVTQLAVSSHLLDIGFPDEWCARHIGLRVAHSLAYANATAFDHHYAEMARLADVLNPYWKWNHLHCYDEPAPDDGGFSGDQIQALLRELLDHVRRITGHPHPSSTDCQPSMSGERP